MMANGKIDGKTTDDIDQHTRFLETARALGCDEDEAAFDEKLKAVVGPKMPSKSNAPSKPDATKR